MNDKFAPQLGVYPMTVVAFMRESDDNLLLAADQQFTSDGCRTYHPKLRQVNGQQIAWSSAGNPAIGLDKFGEWINRYDFTNKNWEVFIEKATSKLSQLNGKRGKMAKTAGAEYKRESMGAEVLIVGWITKKPGAYYLTNDGECFPVLQYKFEAIGSGKTSALVARTAIQTAIHMCRKDLDSLTILKLVMESVTQHVDNCLPPIDIWRINKDFIKDAMGNRLRNGGQSASTPKAKFLKK